MELPLSDFFFTAGKNSKGPGYKASTCRYLCSYSETATCATANINYFSTVCTLSTSVYILQSKAC